MKMRELKHFKDQRSVEAHKADKERLEQWSAKLGEKNVDFAYWDRVANGKVNRKRLKALHNNFPRKAG